MSHFLVGKGVSIKTLICRNPVLFQIYRSIQFFKSGCVTFQIQRRTGESFILLPCFIPPRTIENYLLLIEEYQAIVHRKSEEVPLTPPLLKIVGNLSFVRCPALVPRKSIDV